MYLKSLKKSFKISYINGKSLHISETNFKSLGFFEKSSNYFKKASVPLKMSSKSLVVFEKTSDFQLNN
jgi:hypothetical protein